MRFLRFNFSLFLILFTLLSSPLFIEKAYGDAFVLYNSRTYTANAGIFEINQADITGFNPNQIVQINYRPQDETNYMFTSAAHGLNGSDYGFFYSFDFLIDYDTGIYAITSSPTGTGNTSIWNPNQLTEVGGIGYNVSSTHVLNNVFLAGNKITSGSVTYDVGSQVDWADLGVSSCTDFVTLSADVFHSFVIQLKNDTGGATPTYAYELFINNLFWCTVNVSTGANGPTRIVFGNNDDLGTGTATGNVRTQTRGGAVTSGRNILSEQLAGISSGFGVGNDPTGITIQSFNIQGEITQNHVVGQLVRFQALLLNITDPFGVSDIRLANFPLTISRGGVDLTTAITNDTGWATFLTTPAGASGQTITYTVTFTGSLTHNLANTFTTIDITLIPVGASSFQSTALSTLTARDIDERSRLLFAHEEFIKFRVRLTDELGNPIPNQPIVFHMDKNNTGTFIPIQSADSNSQGVATSQFFRLDSTFIDITRIQARFQGDLQFQASNSTILSITVVSSASQFDLTIRIEPNPVNPGAIYRISGALEIIQPDGIRQSIIGENIQVFRADVDDIWQFLDSKRTDANGLYQISTQNAEPEGSLTIVFRANASVNSIGIISNNITLTINSVDILEDNLPVGAANLDDFFPDIDDINFGFSGEGNGILLWLIFFLMFAFGGIFAMFSTFPAAMSSNVVIAWFIMMFGASTGVSFGLGWIGLNFVILLISPIALIGGIVLLRIFRGGGTT